MHFSSAIAPLALFGLAAAGPLKARTYGDDKQCIPYDTAIGIQTTWISTLTNFDAAVTANLLAPTFFDVAPSINFLIGAPLDSVTFPSPQAYIAGQGAQPPIGFTVLKTEVVTCDGTIVLRWVADVGSKKLPAHGISILKAIKSGPNDGVVGPSGWQLNELYTEFNSAAWVIDIGGSVTLPSFGKA